jgi:hypothetical protein
MPAYSSNQRQSVSVSKLTPSTKTSARRRAAVSSAASAHPRPTGTTARVAARNAGLGFTYHPVPCIA